jgi:hypothetical protein
MVQVSTKVGVEKPSALSPARKCHYRKECRRGRAHIFNGSNWNGCRSAIVYPTFDSVSGISPRGVQVTSGYAGHGGWGIKSHCRLHGFFRVHCGSL